LARYAIGDIQGCYQPLRELLRRLRFSDDRDQLLFVGDLVNRGPESAKVLRFVRDLGGNAQSVLGNHDLHLLAHHFDPRRPLREGDTLQDVLDAPDRDALVEWLLQRPLLLHDAERGDLIVHAGLIPQWTAKEAAAMARGAERALREAPEQFLASMYGNKPDRLQDARSDADRHRFIINVLTRMRYCKADGTVNLKLKDAPGKVEAPWLPWFAHPQRRCTDARIIFGHWSTLGLLRRPGLLALDTGCVWGGSLTAANLDDAAALPVQTSCPACQHPE
jgi:bis(5'-nucleosyl)-tetraphosphatase (symmetrical)